MCVRVYERERECVCESEREGKDHDEGVAASPEEVVYLCRVRVVKGARERVCCGGGAPPRKQEDARA